VPSHFNWSLAVAVVTELSVGKIFKNNGHDTRARVLLFCPQTEAIVVLTNSPIADGVIEIFH
jgi:hypothetical protein